VDGRPWRTVPDVVVVRCGLSVGTELERPLLRELRRELRRAEALTTATRALTARDLSRKRLTERLRSRGITPTEGRRAVAVLEAAGLVDDERLARTRATVLAERGWGDAAIEARLAQEDVPAALVRKAIAELPPERERAVAVSARVDGSRATWSLLARRGFATETIEDVVRRLDDES
jgi:regulatory protein